MAASRRNAKSDDNGDEFGAVPGDVRTEPVATAAQSARPGTGRVGPPTVAQDASAPWYTPPGVTQIVPGEEAPADTPHVGGAIELDDEVDEYGHDVSAHKASGERLAARDDSHDVDAKTPPSGPVAK